MQPFMTDWTEKDGRTNTSDLFNRMVEVVTQLILESGSTLIAGGVQSVARTIVAKLAHVYGLVPHDSDLEFEMVERFKLLRKTLEAIGNEMPGATEDELRTEIGRAHV
jgi:thioester reductase-like protein